MAGQLKHDHGPFNRRSVLAGAALAPLVCGLAGAPLSAQSLDDSPPAPPPRIELAHLPGDILRDQATIWIAPFQPTRDELPWLGAFLGTSAALLATDRRVGQEITESPPGDLFRFGRRVSQLGGFVGDVSTAGAFYLAGRIGRNEHARATGVLAFRVLADTLVVVESLKTVARRPRPTTDNSGRVRNHNADGEFFTGGRSFPSGHATEAWGLATVVACQYSDHGWVPPVAYGLASLVATARVLQRRHFPGDTFVGGVLGFTIGRHVCSAGTRGPAAASRRWRLTLGEPAGDGAGLGLALTYEP